MSNPLFYVKGIWEKGTFTVPADIPEERVAEKAADAKNTFGTLLERRGFKVLEMTNPTLSTKGLKTDPDQKRYVFYARVIRKPEVVRLSIPDKAVPAMQRLGLKLLE